MADVFVSYARSDKARVAPLVAMIEAQGWSVWWDPEISPGQQFDDRIETELAAAKAVLVIWTSTSVASRWVRGEARDAADRGVLVPVRFDGVRLPMDIRAIHTTDLDAWGESEQSPAFQALRRSLATMIERGQPPGFVAATPGAPMRRLAICVLPFANMSGDPDQDYFSDGISEDIITDLSKVSALSVISRNSAFQYKGKSVDVPRLARDLDVSHVLEGSVRKAGGRVRITAQLVNGSSNDHVWAERYDRELKDIFALQDEISAAIVRALKLKLLPEEKKAIEHRGTEHVEAYNLYLMARQAYVVGNESDERSAQAIIRLCTRATEIDPRYARAWALMAIGQRRVRTTTGAQGGDGGLGVAERALALDGGLAAAHAVRAEILFENGRQEEANSEIATALQLEPDSYEVNRAAGLLAFRQRRFPDAIRHWECAMNSNETDIYSAAMLLSCYGATGDAEASRRVAALALERAEKALERDPNNGAVLGYSSYALAALGEAERAKDRMNRAVLIDPGNMGMRYNFACSLAGALHEVDAAIDLLGPVFEWMSAGMLNHVRVDPDLDPLRGDRRFVEMFAAAERRLAATQN
jgi:adenylate cyclase